MTRSATFLYDGYMKPNPEAIRAIRERSGLSITQLAQRLGRSRALVANIEAGRRNGSPEVLRGLATALRVPLDAIITSYSTDEAKTPEPAA